MTHSDSHQGQPSLGLRMAIAKLKVTETSKFRNQVVRDILLHHPFLSLLLLLLLLVLLLLPPQQLPLTYSRYMVGTFETQNTVSMLTEILMGGHE